MESCMLDVPTSIVVEGVPTELVGTGVPTSFVVAIPTRLVGTAYNKKSCGLEGIIGWISTKATKS